MNLLDADEARVRVLGNIELPKRLARRWAVVKGSGSIRETTVVRVALHGRDETKLSAFCARPRQAINVSSQPYARRDSSIEVSASNGNFVQFSLAARRRASAPTATFFPPASIYQVPVSVKSFTHSQHPPYH